MAGERQAERARVEVERTRAHASLEAMARENEALRAEVEAVKEMVGREQQQRARESELVRQHHAEELSQVT